MWFYADYEGKTEKTVDGERLINVPSIWFTNLEHGRRHSPLSLMTMEQNIRYSKHKDVREVGYRKYDNYDAIEVPYTDAIPADYDGIMGVPITFLDKYCPEQFEIIGLLASAGYDPEIVGIEFKGEKLACPLIDGKRIYARILIRRIQQNNK